MEQRLQGVLHDLLIKMNLCCVNAEVNSGKTSAKFYRDLQRIP